MIKEFQGDYRFLSNFTQLQNPILFEGNSYRTVENFYVAMKTLDSYTRSCIAQVKAGEAKRLGRQLKIREDWESVKCDVMLYGLLKKFSNNNKDLLEKLVSTDDKYIQEGNKWGDTFFGICLTTGKGMNILGRMLMAIRNYRKSNGSFKLIDCLDDYDLTRHINMEYWSNFKE